MVEQENKLKYDSLEYWKGEIKAGIKYRTIYGKSRDWNTYKMMYRGLWNKGVVPVNIVYALGRSLIPQVYFRNPRVAVKPRKPGYAIHARVVERLDNYLINETGLKNQLKSGVLDCYLCGRGPGILGYDSEYGFNPSFLSTDYPDLTLTQFNEDKGHKIEYSDNVKPGFPWYMRCNPMDFIVPWGTGRWEEAPWFAIRKMRPLRDIKEDPKYINTNDLKAPFKSRLETNEEGGTTAQIRGQEDDSQNEWAEMFEIHDKRSGLVFVITLDHAKFLRKDEDLIQVEGLGAEVLGFNEDPDYFWWSPDCRMVETQQREMNDIRSMASKHRKLAVLKVLYDKGMLEKGALTKLLDGDPKAAVEIDAGPNGDIRKAVALFQSHVPPDLASAAREVREDVREIIGFSRNQMGSFEESSGRRTAHEAEIVRAASMIRIDERRDIMADHLEKVIRKMNQIIFKNWSAERIIDIIGQDGAKYWIRFTGQEIKGEFAYGINPEESIPEDRRTRKAEAVEFMQIATTVPGVDMKYLLESYASNLGEWLDPQMLFPQSEGAGRSPEKAMQFNDFMRQQGGQGMQSNYPALGGTGQGGF
ncbi:hypothetical protein KKH13_04805 [Patescibacteria group bacterium]|uniref:Putative head tail connector protein n=1 Tax=viral metagenome TaxID=1070528 RepID=A0A6M3KXE5_9ZZZZ|nr:hypothetical protein [Patescibacteria group bacterium]